MNEAQRMKNNATDGYRILSSPAYQWVVLDSVGAEDLRTLLRRFNFLIESFGYQVEAWDTNPIYIVNPGDWVMPTDQKCIHDWMLRQVGCKFVRTERDKNLRTEAMQLAILNESRKPIDLSKVVIF